MAIRLDVAITVAVWMELFIYGIYTALFASALSVMLRRRSSPRGNLSARIFLITTLLMFAVATFHIALALYRFIRAFVTVVNPLGGLVYMYDFNRWDANANSALYCIMVWLGDALVIYRCYYVWNKNIWIIMLPLLLLLAAIAVNIYVLFWFSHLYNNTLNENASYGLLKSIYPLALAQNVITTGLISLKIWSQHRMSRAHGIVDRSSRLSLLRILRIIVESAMIYTLEILVLIILYFCQSNAQIIVQSAIVPSVGIVFVLISIRVHIAKNSSLLGTGLGTLPPWLEENESAIEFSANSSLPQGVVLRVSVENDRDDYSEPFGTSSYTHKSVVSRTDTL